MKPVLLFDLDGVLVEPGGYRAAVGEALRLTFERWGWPLHPLQDLPARFEAAGITSEWDMVPLTLASALEAWAAHHKQVPKPAVLEIHGPSPGPWGTTPPPNFAALPQRIRPHLQKDLPPSEVAWRLQATSSAPFPTLGRSPLAERLLTGTRDPLRSPLTRLFQLLVLGEKAFVQTYGLAAPFTSPSLLRRHDRPRLTPALRDWLQEARRWGHLAVGVLTARPSLPPRGTPLRPGYPPEAEMALEVIGCPDLPLIGFGRLQAFLADSAEGNTEDGAERLLKPHPFHALAALLAALTGDEAQALRLTADWLFRQRPPSRSLFPAPGLHLIVVEDTAPGIQSALGAAEAVRQLGVPVRLTPLGIASHPAKQRSLHNLGVQTFPTLQEALQTLFPLPR